MRASSAMIQVCRWGPLEMFTPGGAGSQKAGVAEMHETDPVRSSTVPQVPPVHPRKLAKVPFLELSEGRLQGVVSSGSDIERVYVSSISAGDHGLSCSTNNNRPCGGLGSSPCKHIQSLLAEAEKQFGALGWPATWASRWPRAMLCSAV